MALGGIAGRLASGTPAYGYKRAGTVLFAIGTEAEPRTVGSHVCMCRTAAHGADLRPLLAIISHSESRRRITPSGACMRRPGCAYERSGTKQNSDGHPQCQHVSPALLLSYRST